MIKAFKAGWLMLAACATTTAHAAPRNPPPRPNIVVIVADDLGFSDLGAFGGEIRTPNLDKLAKAGLRLTDFHAAPTCSPTRSMLLSGTDNHTAGVGAMAESRTLGEASQGAASWGYEGVLTMRVATLAERLRTGGYFTAMAGKWHLGLAPEEGPHARGFDRSFALLQGASNHFGGGFGPESNPYLRATYTEDGKPAGVPSDFYSSDFFTTKLIEQLGQRPKGQPFFAYLAFTAPHSPLQAPAADVARYTGRYDGGWGVLREQRLARMKALALVPNEAKAAPVKGDDWETLSPSRKRIEARKMEIYAAMVDRLDQNVGRLVARLKQTGEFSNTVFVFTADNGAAGETGELFGRLPGMAAYLASRDNSFEAMGSKGSTVFYGPNWAQAATAPYRLYKGVMTEGGTRVAAFVTYRGFKRQGSVGHPFGDVMDVVPTLLEVSGVPAGRQVSGREVADIRGKSMLPYLNGRSATIHGASEPISFELHGQRAVRQGDWKLLWLPKPLGENRWALYDLAADPAEQHDVSGSHTDLKRTLIVAWDAFAREARILDTPHAGL